MIKNLLAYGLTLVSLVIIDGIWIGLVMMPLYQRHLSHVLADTIIIWPVIAFYLLYALGLCYFVVNPAILRDAPILSTFGAGFFLGVLAYAAYDFTNLATIRNWPIPIALLDIVWGGILSAFAAIIGAWLTKLIIR